MSNRIIHIDQAKAIGIMLIIASHICVTPIFATTSIPYKFWVSIINSFYVPLFFLLSGIFESNSFQWNKYFDRLKRLCRYILIFFIFGLLSSGIKGNWSVVEGLHATVVWFLFTLLWITIIFGIIKRFKYNSLIVSILAMGGVLC